MYLELAKLLSTLFDIKVKNKSCLFAIDISVKALYFIITTSSCLKMTKNAGNGSNCAWKSVITWVVKLRSTSETVLSGYYGPCLELPTSRFALGW